MEDGERIKKIILVLNLLALVKMNIEGCLEEKYGSF